MESVRPLHQLAISISQLRLDIVLQNRAFQKVTPGLSAPILINTRADTFSIGSSSALLAWSAVGGAQIQVVDSTTPLSSALPNSLEVTIPKGSTGTVGVANSGYTGIYGKP